MQIYNITKDTYVAEGKKLLWYVPDEKFFVICNPQEIYDIHTKFGFDPYTVSECINLDENIRFVSYVGYDFISLIYFYIDQTRNMLVFSEINLYIGANYIFLVLPDEERIKGNFINFFRNQKPIMPGNDDMFSAIYYRIFDKILLDLFDAMEKYEDVIYEKERRVINKTEKLNLSEIIEVKDAVNKLKKMLRPLLYIGDAFYINENSFIPEDKLKYFKYIDTRMNKLYDFASTLYEKTEQLLYLYDSKINIQTNDLITKLTVLTVFIGPLTVITGIYGMNFEYMPETKFIFGYPVALSVMLIIIVGLFIYFKKKNIL